MTPSERHRPLEFDARRLQREKEWHRRDREFWQARNEVSLTWATTEERREWFQIEQRREALQQTTLADSGRRAYDRLPRDADDEEVNAWADRRAHGVGRIVAGIDDSWAAYAQAKNYVGCYDIEAPEPKKPGQRGPTIASCIRKMMSPRWWRGVGRRAHMRRWELEAIRAGGVNSKAASCASDWAVAFLEQRRKACAGFLESLVAINEDDEEISLADVSKATNANPAIRRAELMARVKGMEVTAEQHGDRPYFVTLTLASRYHPWLSAGGRNKAYDGASTPRTAQAVLCEQWNRIRAVLNYHEVRWYGLRVAEPHHDATPHWHLLLFIAPDHVGLVLKAIRAEALKESPDEPGAKKRRVTIKRIRPGDGTPTGYVSKYISKGVDGFGLTSAATRGDDGQLTLAGFDTVQHAQRVTAWARIWGIRQFQFCGTPPQTVARELRRIREEQMALPLIEPARVAADAGDYAAYYAASGGMCMPRKFRPLWLLREQLPYSVLTNYGEFKPHAVKGVEAFRQSLVTRIHEWRIERRSPLRGGRESGAPWTRVNNCKPPSPLCLSDQGQNLGHPPDLGPIPALQSENSSHERTGNHPHPGR